MRKGTKMKKYRMGKIKFKRFDGVGELMKLKHWVAAVRAGALMDSDGFGEYAMEDKQTSIEVYPRQVYSGDIDVRFTHVVWYNR